MLADVEGQILRRRRAWRRNVVTTNYVPAATTGVRTTSYYAPTDNMGTTTTAAADIAGSGLTYARVPTYRRGLFGRRIQTGTQLRAVAQPAASAGFSGQFEAPTAPQAGFGANARAGVDSDASLDRSARADANLRGDARLNGNRNTEQPGANIRGDVDADIDATAPGANARIGADADIDAPTTNQGNARQPLDSSLPPATTQPIPNNDD
jgi:hypothetical protein